MIEAVNWQKAVISENATFQEAFQNLNDVGIFNKDLLMCKHYLPPRDI